MSFGYSRGYQAPALDDLFNAPFWRIRDIFHSADIQPFSNNIMMKNRIEWKCMITIMIINVTACYHFRWYHIPACRISVTFSRFFEKTTDEKNDSFCPLFPAIPRFPEPAHSRLQHNHQRPPSNFGTISHYHFRGIRVTITTSIRITMLLRTAGTGSEKPAKWYPQKPLYGLYGQKKQQGHLWTDYAGKGVEQS